MKQRILSFPPVVRRWLRHGLLASGLVISAQAQWLTQELPLQPGWNAVFLRVQPESVACADLFAGLQVEGVWKWNGRDQTLQFTESPDRMLPRDDDWLVWLPPSHPQAALSSLHALHANTACLIKVAADAAPFTWRIKGRPRLFRQEWRIEGLNFCGLPVPEETATFAGFFQSCGAIALTRADGGEIQTVNPDGQGHLVWTPARTRVAPGRAYWIRSRRSTDFTGPLRVEPDFGGALVFLPEMPRRAVTLQNATDGALAVTVRLLPSEPQPSGAEYALLAGPVPLAWREQDWSQGRPRTVHHPFDAPVARTLEAGESWTLQLVLRERAMMTDGPDTVRLGLLEITGGPNFREILGVIARR